MLSIDTALSGSMIAAPTFVAAALYPGVRDAFVMDNRLLILLQRTVGDQWHGLTPSQLRAEHQVILLMRKGPTDRTYAPAHQEVRLDTAEEVLAMVWRELLA